MQDRMHLDRKSKGAIIGHVKRGVPSTYAQNGAVMVAWVAEWIGTQWRRHRNMNQPNNFMTAFDFTDEDLAANRAGTLTDKQLAQFKPFTWGLQMSIIVLAVFAVIVIILAIFFSPSVATYINA